MDMRSTFRRAFAAALLLSAAAACTSSQAFSYCGFVDRLQGAETRFELKFLGGVYPAKGDTKAFIEDEVVLFETLRRIAPEAISADLATIAKAVRQTLDNARRAGFDINRTDDPTDDAVDEARTRFDEYNKRQCRLSNPPVEASFVPQSVPDPTYKPEAIRFPEAPGDDSPGRLDRGAGEVAEMFGLRASIRKRIMDFVPDTPLFADEGGVFLAIDVTIDNIGREAYSYPGGEWAIYLPSGDRFDPTFDGELRGGPARAKDDPSLQPGERFTDVLAVRLAAARDGVKPGTYFVEWRPRGGCRADLHGRPLGPCTALWKVDVP